MTFELIDYSESYYRDVLGEEVPEKRAGKFVQIRDEERGREYLVLSPKGLSAYHANIVERFCSLGRAVGGGYNPRKDSFRISDSSWSVVGGGSWAIDTRNRLLELSGASQAYGRFDPRGLKSRLLALRELDGYTITIDGM